MTVEGDELFHPLLHVTFGALRRERDNQRKQAGYHNQVYFARATRPSIRAIAVERSDARPLPGGLGGNCRSSGKSKRCAALPSRPGTKAGR